MTVDLYMLCDRPVMSVDEWQTAIDKLGFDLTLPMSLNVATATGALTARWRGEPVVFEFSAFPYQEIEEGNSGLDFERTWPNAYVMYTGSSFVGCAGVIIAGAALVHCTGGRLFDPQDSLILKPDEAVRYAKETEAQILAIQRSAHH